mmetsp:Transcript_1179/g.1437  ORF Transcript_1179/g.1437 Transcript_1179/m.1437 type:complete len:89 (-) Transcript_1179:865-1131(-)|eukprot:CAMPEP_0185766666 /NCGR_PEP_ID=MMETSP1174-20130828/38571_1 /TAXON_ID=35687 /ORGANISM="Dictyocha speculum, Strain CCMP1381" /LENGTH=88 /DNA_ID=CAMNT_0028450453 /DNA_START=61 /DNA_END=327 /DNA_ORIENTATION=-
MQTTKFIGLALLLISGNAFVVPTSQRILIRALRSAIVDPQVALLEDEAADICSLVIDDQGNFHEDKFHECQETSWSNGVWTDNASDSY